jgi:rRNA biogenesis protein RRP5
MNYGIHFQLTHSSFCIHREEAFPDGKYIECRVIKSFGKQSLVEVSLRKSRVEGDLDEDPTPEVGETAHGYVVQTNKKGCFIRLARHIEGRVTLREICDGFLPDPEKSFPAGRLVVGKIKEIHEAPKKSKHSKDPIRVRVDLDMRESVVLEDEKKLEFEDVEINQKFKGTVTRIESYGVFVQLENSRISGLVHLSECSDKFVKNLEGMYDPGDPVKILVIKKDLEAKKFGFSMKASHFEDDEDSDDESSGDSAEDDDMVDVAAVDSDDEDEDNDLNSDDENFGAKLAAKMQQDGGSSDGDSSDSDDDDDSSDSDDGESEAKKGSKALDTDVGFEWGGGTSSKQGTGGKKDDSDDESSSDEDEDGDDAAKTSSHKSRKKQAERRREEREISRREVALADGTADENPETAGDFERLLAGNPNSSELWIRYMAFHLSLSDIPAARAVAEKAMGRIEFRQEREKLNVWTALLTLEHKYGDKKSFLSAIERASGQNNPKQVYLRACEILEKDTASPDLVTRADNMFSKMCKKFKSKKTVWLAHLQYLLKQHRHQEAHALSKRALLSLAEYKHAETMSRFAQLEFEFGSLERARTLFDGIVEKYSKRLDLFFVYVDKEIKFGSLETARALLQKKAGDRSLSDKKMKNMFKKWYRLEEEHGTEESQEEVKASARAYVEKSS